jgi:hypothetical protein
VFTRVLAGIALILLLFARPEISSALGAYDNGLLTLLAPVITFTIVVIGPVVVVASMVVAITIWALALFLNLAVLVVGRNRVGYAMAAKVTLYILSALIFVGLLLAITNFGQMFVKGGDAEGVSIWALAFPVAFALIALFY